MERGSDLEPGDFHLVVNVWNVNEAGDYLIQRRAPHLASAPGAWATTGGCVLSGEASDAAVVREVMEELGIDLRGRDLLLVDRLVNRSHLEDVWLVRVNAGIGPVSLGPEVIDSRWVPGAELGAMAARGDFFPYSYLGELIEGPVPRSLTPPAPQA
jgi:8-oxo-dGTP pyrophosphatase MutT (NUDIX family)